MASVVKVIRAIAVASTLFATSEAFAQCSFGTSGEPSLQNVFDSILPPGALSAADNCLPAESDKQWTAVGEAVATIIIELAGFSGSNVFGIYDVTNPSNRVTVFNGADGVGASTTIELWQNGAQYSVWTDGFYAAHFATNVFGFVLSTPQGNVFTSDPAHNVADGQDHMYAYRGTGVEFSGGPLEDQPFAETMYLLAFEDLLIPQGDEDYQDFVAVANFVVPIPLPAGVWLLAGALVFLARWRRSPAAPRA